MKIHAMSTPPFRSYVSISRSRIAANFRTALDAVGPGVTVCGVVKADAYGHGAVEISGILEKQGAKWLAVSSVDEGIASYRPEGLQFAHALCKELGIEHRVVRYEDTVGWEMDQVVAADPTAIPCGYCGVFRRSSLNRAAREADADYVATGLNLDDTAQSILMNVVRGDVEKLARLGPHERRQPGLVPRLQPLRMVPEKEVYLYAMLRGIRFHDGTCPHSERAQRGRFREILNRLEADSPGTRHAILSGYDRLRPLFADAFPPPEMNECVACREPTANLMCKACELQMRLDEPRGRARQEPETVR